MITEQMIRSKVKRIPMKTISPFSIIPRVYEKELDNKYGIVLGDLRNGEKSGFRGDLEKNVSFSKGANHSIEKINDRILKKYESVPGFCSMIVKDEDELMRHIKNIHELSYNHYVFGKENNMKNKFPRCCCGFSAANLFLNLMEKGYPNASLFSNHRHSHTYNGLPFLFGKNREKMFIGIDPTSDQLFNDKKNAPRNYLFVVSGDKWIYETDWENGADLFPSSKDNSSFSNLETLRSHPCPNIYESSSIDEYFEKVFENPVEVSVESF